MPSQYLTGTDLALYGVAKANQNLVVQASAIIDAYLRRPEGMIWMPDSQGGPCYMSTATPVLTFACGLALTPTSLSTTLSSSAKGIQPGEVLILDRATPGLVEAAVVQTVSQPGTLPVTVSFQTLLNSHSINASADMGMVITDIKYMPKSRPVTRLSRTPVANVISGVGRYAYGRRGDASDYNMEQFNLLAAVSKFGGPPVWEVFQANYPIECDYGTGELWAPAGVMLAYYSQVKIRYVAGFNAAGLPPAIKQACASLISALTLMPDMGSAKSVKAGDTSIERFAATVLSDDIKQELSTYTVRAYV